MIEIMPESTERMLAVRATGTLTDEDYTATWIPALESIIGKFEVANALLYMDENFKGWEAKALWDDAKFGIRHRNDFRRIAIVGGSTWIKWGVRLGEMLMDCEVRVFEPEALSEAIRWCSETVGCACDK